MGANTSRQADVHVIRVLIDGISDATLLNTVLPSSFEGRVDALAWHSAISRLDETVTACRAASGGQSMALRMGLSLVGLIAGFGAGFGCTFAGGARGNIPVLVVGCVFVAVFIASLVALILLSLKGQAQAKRWLRLTMDTLGGRPMPGTVSLRQLNEELRGVLFFEVRKVLPNGFELSVKLLSVASTGPLAPPENIPMAVPVADFVPIAKPYEPNAEPAKLDAQAGPQRCP